MNIHAMVTVTKGKLAGNRVAIVGLREFLWLQYFEVMHNGTVTWVNVKHCQK